MFDAPEKPVDMAKLTGEPDDTPNSDMAAALGLPNQSPPSEESTDLEDEKSQAEGQKLVDTYSAKIQEQAEELYGTLLLRAKDDPTFLDALVESKDKIERKYAEKILSRNSDLFGAKSIEEYKQQKALKDVSDPNARKLIEIENKLHASEKRQEESAWEDFKRDSKIAGDFASFCDDLRSEHPDLPYGKLVAMAKGLQGGDATPKSKREHSSATGSVNPAEEEADAWNHPMLSRLIRDPESRKQTRKFAKEYFGH
jgi:hypothetical protein